MPHLSLALASAHGLDGPAGPSPTRTDRSLLLALPPQAALTRRLAATLLVATGWRASCSPGLLVRPLPGFTSPDPRLWSGCLAVSFFL